MSSLVHAERTSSSSPRASVPPHERIESDEHRKYDERSAELKTSSIPTRRVSFEFADDFNPVWTQRPEFACAANSVSLLMPFVEPYVVRSVRSVSDQLDGTVAADAAAFVKQEAQHHAQHRKLNKVLVANYPALRHVERWMGRTFSFLDGRSPEFSVAYAAGSEAVAFAAARWIDRHADSVLRGADPEAAGLYLWHFAEEVEHKAVAMDVYRAINGRRSRYVLAMLLSAFVLAWFSVIGTLVMLWKERRFFSPVAHARLFLWSITFLFVLLPIMAMSSTKNHSPRDLVDPLRLQGWITGRSNGFDDLGVNIPR